MKTGIRKWARMRISGGVTISPPSVLGVGGLFTNYESPAYAAYAALNRKENKFKVRAAQVQGNLNYDLYGTPFIRILSHWTSTGNSAIPRL